MTRPDEVRIGVDLRVEAVMGAIAVTVSRLPHGGWIDHPLRRKARRGWSGLQNHPAPGLVRSLLGTRFWVDDLLRLALTFLDEQGGRLERRAPAEPGAPAMFIGCDRFAAALVDFAARAQLDRLAAAYAEVAAEVEEAVGGARGIRDCQALVTANLGPGPRVVRVTPSPLSNAHLGYGPTIGREPRRESWIVFGPVWKPTRRLWNLVGFSSPKLRGIVRHELGHAHLNPLTDAAAVDVGRHADLFIPLAPAMRPLGYGRWDICLNEHILRAMEVRIVRAEEGTRSAERWLRRQEEKGFTLVRSALAALEGLGRTPLADAYGEFLERLAFHASHVHVSSRTPALPAAV
jgi:hypothetical protein